MMLLCLSFCVVHLELHACQIWAGTQRNCALHCQLLKGQFGLFDVGLHEVHRQCTQCTVGALEVTSTEAVYSCGQG